MVRLEVEAGKAVKTDLLAAISQRASGRTALPPPRQQESLACHALSTLAGETPDGWWPPDFDLAAPIFHGGTLEAPRRAAVDAYRAALASYQQTVLQAFQQVADVLQALAHDAELLRAEHRALSSAKASLGLTRESYAAGRTNIINLLDAERLYQQALLGYLRAESQRYADTVQLFAAMGGGWWHKIPVAKSANPCPFCAELMPASAR